MSDTVANAIIGGFVTIVLGILNLVGIRMARQTGAKVDKLEQHTNGMQKRLEEMAHSAGVQEEKDRREQP